MIASNTGFQALALLCEKIFIAYGVPSVGLPGHKAGSLQFFLSVRMFEAILSGEDVNSR